MKDIDQQAASQGNAAIEEEIDQNTANIAENYLYDSEEAASAAIEAFDFRPANVPKAAKDDTVHQKGEARGSQQWSCLHLWCVRPWQLQKIDRIL